MEAAAERVFQFNYSENFDGNIEIDLCDGNEANTDNSQETVESSQQESIPDSSQSSAGDDAAASVLQITATSKPKEASEPRPRLNNKFTVEASGSKSAGKNTCSYYNLQLCIFIYFIILSAFLLAIFNSWKEKISRWADRWILQSQWRSF